MRVPDLIRKKQHREVLTPQEIDFFIQGYSSERIPDYQASALCMAIWFNGMTTEETAELTMAMARSGDQIDLSAIPGIKVDKHSSGGVADTTTIAIAPLVAACGGKVAKMSGRGLMHSGGTLDKLESIPGYQVFQDMDSFAHIVNTCGASIIGQTANLVPADKRLYSLRDVTSTVDSMPLIASSIMSKKLASGSDKILLDVKWGTGAFMQTVDEAAELARIMVDIGKHAGRPTVALVTDMNQPLGNAVGNALEVIEAIEILSGRAEGDLKELIMELSARILVMGEVFKRTEDARAALQEAIRSGRALDVFEQIIRLHGGDPAVCRDTSRLPQAASLVPVRAKSSGYVMSMDSDEIGMATVMIGAGRETKSDRIDPAVGLWLKKRIGDAVCEGDVLAEFHVNDRTHEQAAIERFLAAVHIGSETVEPCDLIVKVVE
jgi:pyrimidine-nucleoside phosphorylase